MLSFFVKTAKGAVSIPDFYSSNDIGTFLSYIYTFAISIVGILILIRFVYAGWLYLVAAGNSSKTDRAKSIMRDSIIGAIILFSAYLILYVINPDLVSSSFKLPIPKE